MYEPDFATIARHMMQENVRIRAGETVLIRARADAQNYAESIGAEAARAGGHPLIVAANDEFRLHVENETPPDVLGEAPPHLIELINNSDVIIKINTNWRDPHLSRRVIPERATLVQKRTKPVMDAMYATKARRVIVTDFPTAEQASFYGIDFKKYHLLFWRAVEVPPATLRERGRAVRDKLRDASDISIKSKKGTDLTFSIAGRKILVDDGILGYPGNGNGPLIANVPAGEVYCAPLEDSVKGRVVLDRVFIQGEKVADLVLEFENGGAKPVAAKAGFDIFNDFVEAGHGDCLRLGEFGIGLNPAVVDAYGSILTDEKMVGTVHLALGENRFMGGTNSCSFHQDMLIFEPMVAADGTVIVDKGELAGIS
ncbi:MAG: aminopeptidase [candidate division Zixibacteria bacterium]|nr:aminopeptidase [candidate division Zixibacteria bacterium]